MSTARGTEDPIYAYCGKRAEDRNTTTGERRHAVTAWSRLSGALDAECGELSRVPAGPWDPADPLNCPTCTAYLAGEIPVPEDVLAAERATAREATRQARKLVAAGPAGTLSIFAA